ncbi:MAG: transcription elongation factor GreA [Endomicrobium sp.]|nr:transcription elongation factor GreA [Endomicrobium sp.]
MSEIYLTKDGKKKLIEELKNLKNRKILVQKELSDAREHGDLRENSEYNAAKETLANIITRIGELNFKILNSKLIEDQNIDFNIVSIGVKVLIEDDDCNKYQYTIVDIEESNIEQNKISVQSPLIQGLLGHKIGDIVEIELPGGKNKFKILKIFK